MGVGLVFGVGGVGEVVSWDGHGWQGRWSGFGKGDCFGRSRLGWVTKRGDELWVLWRLVWVGGA